MMDALTPFVFEDNLVRSLSRNGDPWFVLVDVCRALEHTNPSKAAERLDDDEKNTITISEGIQTGPGNPNVIVINESGLYSLILTSRKPAAKRFKKWVTSEVLPSIRKTGGYGKTDYKAEFAAQNQAIALAKSVERETNPTTRRMLHAMLTDTLRKIGMDAPALDDLGMDAPPPPDILGPFWESVERLESLEAPINHARDPALIAVSLPQLVQEAEAHGVKMPDASRLRRALRQSQHPRFVANKTVRSAITGVAVQCWVFARFAA